MIAGLVEVTYWNGREGERLEGLISVHYPTLDCPAGLRCAGRAGIVLAGDLVPRDRTD